jgi:two-component SAPR family response regulator
MTIIAVDDEQAALNSIERAVRAACPDAQLELFNLPRAALNFAANTHVDVAFLDIEMHEMTGLRLALELKRKNVNTNIVFVTGYTDYMGNSLSMRVSGYIMKPATVEAVRDELENLRFPPPLPALATPVTETEEIGVHTVSRVRVRCFGSFAVFVDGMPYDFTRTKVKEILAYLIDRRGAFASLNELIAVVWEDEPCNASRKSQMRTLVAELQQNLKDLGAGHWIVKKRGAIAIIPKNVNCDYYDFLRGDMTALNVYTGEYMAQYSWAEFTTSWIERTIETKLGY